MANIGSSWVRVNCDQCKERRTFFLKEDWVLECSECGSRKGLNLGMLTRGTEPAPPVRSRMNLSFT